MALKWDDLFLSGSVVDLHISQWLGQIRIKQADLGIESDAVSKVLSLGHHKLVPRKAFDEINNVVLKAKQAVDKRSVNFGFIRGARFVPEKNMAKLIQELNDIHELFDDAVGAFLKAYDEISENTKPVIYQALLDAAHSGDAADAAMNRIALEYPTTSELSKKYSMSWSVYAIKGPNAQYLNGESDKVRDVLKDMITDLRSEVSEKVGTVLSIVTKGGTLRSNSVRAALDVMDRVENVNVFNDSVLSDQINKIRQALSSVNSGQIVDQKTVAGLEEIRYVLESDIDAAVVQAEESLTILGRRRLEV